MSGFIQFTTQTVAGERPNGDTYVLTADTVTGVLESEQGKVYILCGAKSYQVDGTVNAWLKAIAAARYAGITNSVTIFTIIEGLDPDGKPLGKWGVTKDKYEAY